ncbi:hypothetical protein AVEN_167983-1 [Araneus ventricosus]|uniref:Uncharacterized protein n=1 Tax=Araneus ventricosus TaxID=182803 RepID=A0A4Y2SD80_ARAVE|nr:hypothetical protein AVEN_167983-1 [Araneus ventricosus]
MVRKDNWTPLPRLALKRSQNLTSPQKTPTASDRLSSLLKGNFLTARDRLARYERVKGRPGIKKQVIFLNRTRGHSCKREPSFGCQLSKREGCTR